MKRYAYLLTAIFLSACTGALTLPPSVPLETAGVERAAAPMVFATSTAQPTITLTAIPTPTADLYAELHVTETALALYRAALEQQAQAAAITQMAMNVQLTSDAATSTAVKAVLNDAQVVAINTQNAKTAIAGTPTAVAATLTAYAPTQIAIYVRQRADSLFISGTRWVGLIFLVAVAIIAILAAYRFIQTWHFNNARIKPNEKGQFDVVPEASIPGKSKNLVNPNIAHRAVSGQSLDDLTAEQALMNVNADRMKQIEIMKVTQPAIPARRGSLSMPRISPTGGVQISPTLNPDFPQLQVDQNDVPALPNWSMLNAWDGHLLPYGADVKGLLLADPTEEPHWLIVGRTRTYKSRGGLRTVATAALTMGYQVLFIGKRVDFYPFEGHANAKIVGVDLLNDPQKYFATLRRVAALMKERDDYLTSRRLSIWQQTGLPQLFVVLDEFSSAVKQLNSTKSGAGNLVSTMATALIQEGGKYGINIIQVVQDATGANVDISARRNMGRMVFRVSEQKASDVALGVSGDPSAVGLPARHFLSVIGDATSVIRGAAFAPSDDEVRDFLQQRPVNAHEPMTWVDGEIVEEPPAVMNETTAVDSMETSRPVTVVSADAQRRAQDEIKIRDLYLGFLSRKEKPSLAEIERLVFGKTGGSYHHTVKRICAQVEMCDVDELAGVIAAHVEQWTTTESATTTEIALEVPNFGTNPSVVGDAKVVEVI